MSTSAFSACELIEISATTTPSSDGLLGVGKVLRVANAGAVVVLVTPYISGATPSVNTVAVMPSSVVFLSIADEINELQVATASGTATVYVNRGDLAP